MARYRLTIEYVGTRYSGWQIQKNARTVQGEIERAIRELPGAGSFDLYGSGRTDAGVHALCQIAHLDLDTTLSPPRLAHEINAHLPADINILAAEQVSPRFHARHGAVGRSYVYQISRRRTAFAKPFVWWVRDSLDVAAMRSASAHLVGLKDFRAFTQDEPEQKSTRALIERIEIAEEGDYILIRVQGSHFLWKLVRRMVGVLVEVGRGRLAAHDVARLLREPGTDVARLTAPPSGLFLERVLYEGDRFDLPLRGIMNVSSREAAPSPEAASMAAKTRVSGPSRPVAASGTRRPPGRRRVS
jgi:tRNA pseudouridine38-40 synthase